MTPSAQLLHHSSCWAIRWASWLPKAQAVPLPQPLCGLSATTVGRLECALGSVREGFLEAGSVCVRWDPIAARSALCPLRGCASLSKVIQQGV